jgi:hypothetical protein
MSSMPVDPCQVRANFDTLERFVRCTNVARARYMVEELHDNTGWAHARFQDAYVRVRAEAKPSRYESPDRVHDIRDMCDALAYRLHSLTTAREVGLRYCLGKCREDSLSDDPPTKDEQLDAQGGVAGGVGFLVDLLASRWLPAVFVIAAHLPPQEVKAFTADASLQLNCMLRILDSMHTEFRSPERERLMWVSGLGVLDAATLAVRVNVLDWTIEQVERLPAEDEVGAALRTFCRAGMRDLDAAFDAYWERQKVQVKLAYLEDEDLNALMRATIEEARGHAPGRSHPPQ